jgi:hypothetical protein
VPPKKLLLEENEATASELSPTKQKEPARGKAVAKVLFARIR